MKIIKNATKEPKKIICPFCSSVLVYTFKDIKREENLFHNSVVKRFIICPVCKNNIDLDPKPQPPKTYQSTPTPQKKGGKE